MEAAGAEGAAVVDAAPGSAGSKLLAAAHAALSDDLSTPQVLQNLSRSVIGSKSKRGCVFQRLSKDRRLAICKLHEGG